MSPYRKAWIAYLLSILVFVTPISLGKLYGVTFSTGAFLVAPSSTIGAFLVGMCFVKLKEEMQRVRKNEEGKTT